MAVKQDLMTNILDAKHFFYLDILQLGANQYFGSNIWDAKNLLFSNILNLKISLFLLEATLLSKHKAFVKSSFLVYATEGIFPTSFW